MGLLSVDTTTTNEGTILHVYEIGGKPRRIYPPFQPYLYSLRPIQRGHACKRKLLSTMQEQVVWKQSFPDVEELERCRNAFTTEDNFPFKMRIAIDTGYKWASGYPSMMSWDMETFTDGISPNWRTDTVRSIATWGKRKDDRAFFHNEGKPKETILEFLEHFRSRDPDVPTGFFDRFYDYPTLMQNCNRFRIKCALGRDGSIPYILSKEFERRGKGKIENTIRIRGRVPFDVHKEVDADYTLTLAGLKNRGLKEVARHYGMNPIEVDYSTMDKLLDEELKAYNLSDAECTYKIAQIYFRTLWELAEYLNISVDMVVQRNPSWISNIVLGREYHRLGIISDMPNNERFPQFFQSGRKAIQGAEPKSFRSGTYIKNVKHKDFVGMYVNIMRAFNLSPETISLISIKPYTGQYHFEPNNDSCIVEVPDNKNGQVTVRIDLSKKGVQTKILDDITEKRNVIKEQWKKSKDPALWSQQIMLKLVGNASWGYHGMAFANYGSILVGCLNTAFARYFLDLSIKAEEQVGNTMLESDTDGYFYVENKPIKFDVKKFIPSCFDASLITQETENIQGIIILEDISQNPAAKSYILKDSDGKVTFHGSSVLGRHVPPIIETFIKELSNCLFSQKDSYDVLRSWNKKRILSYPTKMFISQVTFSKRPDHYKETTLYSHLYKTLKTNNIPVKWGDKVNFLKATHGYVPTICFKEGFNKIDTGYYQNRMADIASRMLQVPFKNLKQYFDGNIKMEMFF